MGKSFHKIGSIMPMYLSRTVHRKLLYSTAGVKGYMEFPPNKFLTESNLRVAIGVIKYRGEISNMAAGLNISKQILTQEEYGIRSNIPRTILLISVGSPINADLVEVEAKNIKAENIRIITVGISPKVSYSRS